MNAILVIDKPSGMTSHDVVNRVRRIIRERSVGHLGTLDPLATGVLPLITGNLTRLAQFYSSSTKSYEGVIRFGFATDTYDAKGEPVSPELKVALTLESVQNAARKFNGVMQQTPPPFSAKKVNGVPAYKLARKHQEVKLAAVSIEIKDFEVLSVENDCASFRATVTSGTYMRSIAHEMGQEMGCGAHLAALRRTALGGFVADEAHTLEALQAAAHAGTLDELAIHPRKILPEIPAVTVTEDVVAKIRSGRPVNLPELSKSRLVKVFAGQKDLIAIATRVAGTLFHAKIVLSGEPAAELAAPKGK